MMESALTIGGGKATRMARTLIATTAAASVFALYWLTLAQTVTGEDSGELIAAAYTGGVPHPPGYPLWAILARLSVHLVPLGEIAWRVNLFSAVCAAAAVFVMAQLAYEIGLSSAGVLTAALLFGLSKAFWSQSIITEVYTLAAFAVLTCLYFVMRYENTGRDRYFYAATFFFGLAVVAHELSFNLLPVLLVFVLTRHWRQLLTFRRLLTGFVLACAPLALFGYLMFCARGDPALNWGDPSDISRLWHHFMRQQYPNEFTKNPRSLVLFLRQCGQLIGFGVREFTPAVCALAPAGAFVLWRGISRRKAAWVAALFFVGTVGYILESSTPIEREELDAAKVVLIDGWMALAIVLGAGVELAGGALFIGKRTCANGCTLCAGPCGSGATGRGESAQGQYARQSPRA